MKTTILRRFFYNAFLLVLLHQVSMAQSITINTVSATSFCAGDPISVNFTATGTWGHKNAFTLQLSDSSGSFDGKFVNIGSILDTVGGTITLVSTMPNNIPTSEKYRIKILGAVPYTLSSDNGTDLLLVNIDPNFSISEPSHHSEWGVGVPISLKVAIGDGNARTANDSIYWDFGADATPSTLVESLSMPLTAPTIIYSTGGMHTIHALVTIGNCSRETSYTKYVYDCTSPSIPKNAIIFDHDTLITTTLIKKVLWINPGVRVDLRSALNDTIYAESGSILTGGATLGHSVLYLKAGVSAIGIADATGAALIYEDGVSLPKSSIEARTLFLQCPSLHFDYSQAPPNVAFNGGVGQEQKPNYSITPNPAHTIITVSEAPLTISNVQIFDVLGQVVATPELPHASNFTIDVSTLQTGTYYLRIVSGSGVYTQKIIKN